MQVLWQQSMLSLTSEAPHCPQARQSWQSHCRLMENSLKLRACLDFWGNPGVLHEGAFPVPDGRPMLLVHVCQGQNVEHVILGTDEGQLLGISSREPAQPCRLVRVDQTWVS